MIIKPIDVAAVTRALQAQLEAALPDATVERSEPVNMDPARCPWIGIYRSGVQYPTRVLGFGSGMREQRVELLVLVQQSDGKSGTDCEDRTEQLVRDTISAILSGTTLGGTVDTVDGFDVRYPDYTVTEDGAFYLQTAAIYLTAVTTTRAE